MQVVLAFIYTSVARCGILRCCSSVVERWSCNGLIMVPCESTKGPRFDTWLQQCGTQHFCVFSRMKKALRVRMCNACALQKQSRHCSCNSRTCHLPQRSYKYIIALLYETATDAVCILYVVHVNNKSGLTVVSGNPRRRITE